MGQLLSYNHDEQKRMYVYFFGQVSSFKKQNIIELYSTNNISIKELTDTPNGIVICDILDINTIQPSYETASFENWLDANVEYKESALLSLKNICKLYFGKTVHSRMSSKYRKQVEKWISKKYPNITCKYTDSSYNNIKYKGWRDLQLKNSS